MSQCGEWIRDRVSVVTPVYNGEKHLYRLLDSLLAQSWAQMEVILVDDGSQDKTLEAAEAYRERFQERGYSYQIISAEHRNASAAINQGLPLVTGEFLIWPDSDDALEPDSIRKRVVFLRENPQFQCVRSLGRYLDEGGGPADREEQQGDLQDQRLFFPLLESKTFVCCGCYMLRTKAFFSIYPQRKIPEYDVGQNFQMLLPFMYFHLCPTIEEELYTVYVRQDSHSHRKLTAAQKEKKYADYEEMIDQLAKICGIRDPKELRRIQLWKQQRRFGLYQEIGKKFKAVKALFWVFWYGGVGFFAFTKKFLKVMAGPEAVRRFRSLKRKKEEGRDCASF